MIHKKHPSTLLVATSLTALLLAACSKADRDTAAQKTSAAYEETKNAVAHGWDNLKSATFEKRDQLTTELKAKQAALEAEVSQLRADYSEAQASASRKTAMAELKDAEANYQDKLSALGNATAETWNAARDNVIAAWDRLQASYAKARAS